MRITTGKFKGRVLKIPKGIRPTQEKVRKAFFDIIGDIEGLKFLELFAGSGAVGFEAVSRGVKELALVENNRNCQIAIKANIESLKIENCYLYPQSVDALLSFFKRKGQNFDLIFCDPPYCSNASLAGSTSRTEDQCSKPGSPDDSLSKKTLQMLGAYDILAPNGLIAMQHFKKDELPRSCGEFILVKEARYGNTRLSFYRKEG
jgi:16S rRNA (guanine966-N2)-methyltransferase